MKVDVAFLGVVRNGERPPASLHRKAVLAMQVPAAGLAVESVWLQAWWALPAVAAIAAVIAVLQTLFTRYMAREDRAVPDPPRDTGGFYITGEVDLTCPACARAEQYRVDELQEVPRG